jgi:hypothetical protein
MIGFGRKRDANTDENVTLCSGIAGTLSLVIGVVVVAGAPSGVGVLTEKRTPGASLEITESVSSRGITWLS